MRTIKFRAWDIKRELYHIVWELHFSDEGDEPFSHEEIKIYYKHEWFWLNRDEYILEQSTGLLDKNGKEIYEGDIVLLKDGRKEIIAWSVERGGFEILHWTYRHELEIIGTIHDKEVCNE